MYQTHEQIFIEFPFIWVPSIPLKSKLYYDERNSHTRYNAGFPALNSLPVG